MTKRVNVSQAEKDLLKSQGISQQRYRAFKGNSILIGGALKDRAGRELTGEAKVPVVTGTTLAGGIIAGIEVVKNFF